MQGIGDLQAIILAGVFGIIVVVACFVSAVSGWNKPKKRHKFPPMD